MSYKKIKGKGNNTLMDFESFKFEALIRFNGGLDETS